ncbi:MAG: CobQ-like glutamine amidotransferase family enzyme [Aquiluna sp.]
MSSYFSFHKDYFDNNGDQGNLSVLNYFLSQQSVLFDEVTDPDSADFVIVGDASRAALREYGIELLALAPALQKRHSAGLATLVIGSSYEFLASQVSWLETPKLGPITSEFRTVDTLDAGPIVGYRNSSLLNLDFVRNGDFIGTTLFGPILAKNPTLLDQMLLACGGSSADWKPQMLDWVEAIRESIPT